MDLPNNSEFSDQQIYDIIIIGLGAMGSASFYQSCTLGKTVLGIEQYELLHQNGSSHGETRAIRESYFEGSFYIPMVKESLKMWRELETIANEQLYVNTGALMIGKQNSQMIEAVKKGYEKFNVNYEQLSSSEIKQKYQEFLQFSEEYVGILETGAGLLFPEKCIETMINQGLKSQPKSKIMTKTEVTSFYQIENGLIKVDLSNNTSYYSHKLIVSPGMWATEILAKYQPQYKHVLKIQENTLFWFESHIKTQFQVNNFPLFFVELEDKNKCIYGFPKIYEDGLTKFALHGSGRTFPNYTELKANQQKNDNKDEDTENREMIQRCVQSTFDNDTIKSLKNECNCYYTTTLDENFIIDYLNNNPNIVFLSPCSGHGFKFAIYIGKLAVQMTEEFKIHHEEFAFKRFDK